MIFLLMSHSGLLMSGLSKVKTEVQCWIAGQAIKETDWGDPHVAQSAELGGPVVMAKTGGHLHFLNNVL